MNKVKDFLLTWLATMVIAVTSLAAIVVFVMIIGALVRWGTSWPERAQWMAFFLASTAVIALGVEFIAAAEGLRAKLQEESECDG